MCTIQEVTSFLVIIAILPNVILSAPGKVVEEKPLGMYEVIVQKCPDLEKTDIKKNLSEIFDKKCVDWTAIDKVTVLTDDNKTNVQCLLLYESILPFCTKIGEKIIQFASFIKDSLHGVYDLETVCDSEKSLVKTLKNSTHNLTNILHLSTCPLICTTTISNGKPKIAEMCSMAYFLNTFDVIKLLSSQASLDNHKVAHSHEANIASEVVNKENEEVQPQIAKGKNDSDLQKKPSSNNDLREKPVKTDPLTTKASNVKVPLTNQVDNEKPKVVEASVVEGAAPHETETQNQPPKTEETEILNKNEKPETNEETVPVKKESSERNPDAAQDTHQDLNEDAKDADDTEQKGALGGAEGGTNEEAKDDFAEGNENYADDSGGDKDPLGIPKYGLPDKPIPEKKTTVVKQKPSTLDEDQKSIFPESEDDMDGDSYFFSYFSVLMCLVIVGYVAYHNRQKVLALLLEGKSGRRGSRMGRRPNSANYHKLDSNLEEAISSSCTKNASNVIY